MRNLEHYRNVAVTCLRWVIEPSDGMIRLPGSHFDLFDQRLLDYQQDFKRAIESELHPNDIEILYLVHRDGLSPEQAAERVRHDVVGNAARLVWAIEVRLGLALDWHGLDDVRDYFNHTRFQKQGACAP